MNTLYETKTLTQREEEWGQIELLIQLHQSQFSSEDNEDSGKHMNHIRNEINKFNPRINTPQDAIKDLLDRFSPLFKKYMSLLKKGVIDFNDAETKAFVSSFISDTELKRALGRKKVNAIHRNKIYKKFNFIKSTYGQVDVDLMYNDLQMFFLILAKRYKPIGKSFCAYVYNVYKFEVSRYIKKFIKEALNIPYKNASADFQAELMADFKSRASYIDQYYEDTTGLPDFDWITGVECSIAFNKLTTLERKILVKYYLENWNDRQISEEYLMHINTVNEKRRKATRLIAQELNIDASEIKRSRKSGKTAILPVII